MLRPSLLVLTLFSHFYNSPQIQAQCHFHCRAKSSWDLLLMVAFFFFFLPISMANTFVLFCLLTEEDSSAILEAFVKDAIRCRNFESSLVGRGLLQ